MNATTSEGAAAPVGPEARAGTAEARERRRAVLTSGVRRSRRALLLFLGLALACFLVVNIGMGEASVSAVVRPMGVLRVIGHHVPGVGARLGPLPTDLRAADIIVWQIRLPRALGAALVGMLLALAGVAFQSLLMNPLADPYTVGVSSGAAVGSMAVFLLGGADLLGGFGQPLAAFAAGIATMVIVYMLARLGGRVSAHSFLLAGLSVGTFLWSLIPLMLALASRSGSVDRENVILSELLGHLTTMDWRAVGILALFGVVGGIALGTGAEELDILTLGEESAAHLGVNTEAMKRRVIVAGSLVTAASVAMAGIIAFVGLIVPHIARRLVGPQHRILLPTSALLGGLLLVFADWLSRVYLNQLEIGVITSLIGAPFFCYLLRRRMQSGR
jgi:iron complex transport system permease protein